MNKHLINLNQLSTKDIGLMILGLSGLAEPIKPCAFQELSPKEKKRVKELYLALKAHALNRVGLYYDEELVKT
tara:strand:+ start:165 stop:383 length:219 start_codon:yes stop_codon:yes gene_type:complete